MFKSEHDGQAVHICFLPLVGSACQCDKNSNLLSRTASRQTLAV
jgi:hypothetical protein